MVLIACGVVGIAFLGLKLAQRCYESARLEQDVPSDQNVQSDCHVNNPPRGVCRVGYALNSKKLRKSSAPAEAGPRAAELAAHDAQKKIWRGGGLSDVLKSPYSGITFEAFDYDLSNEQEFDVIIHKLTEDIESTEADSIRKIESISEYLKRHPGTAIVDPLSAVRTVVSRARTALKLAQLIESSESCAFKQPKFAIAYSPEMIKSAIREQNLSYPVICKPIEACGTPIAHSMVVAVSEEGLSLVSCPCVIQEYIDHNGRFCKVYVIDNEVMVFLRDSLPNLSTPGVERARPSEDATQSRSVAFDSRYKYPTVEDFYNSGCQASAGVTTPSKIGGELSCAGADNHSLLRFGASNLGSSARVHGSAARSEFNVSTCEDLLNLAPKFSEAARVISNEFSLTLFGFDVIIPATKEVTSNQLSIESDLVVIDINFFPSYKEIPDFPDKLCSYMRKCAGLDDPTAILQHEKSL